MYTSINSAEILGRVGSVRIYDISGQKLAQMTVVTEFANRDLGGGIHVDNDWHYVKAINGKDISDVESIRSGDLVYVKGRICSKAIISRKGEETRFVEILASKLKILN